MKNLILMTFGLLLAFYARAEENEKVISSKIDGVTVFIQGAQVHRSGSTLIPKGTSYLVFDDVSAYINQQSIQASGKGNFTIMDVQYRYHYPKPETVQTNELPTSVQREINKLRDSIELQSLRLVRVQEKIQAITYERQLIMNHPLMKGQGKPDSLELLKGTVAYMQHQLIDIANRNMELSIVQNRTTQHMAEMQTQLQVLLNYNANKPQPKPEQPKHQVIVMVNAATAVNGTVQINYAVRNAGWSPWYDIKAKSAGEKVELTYKAAVYQQTGEDWSDVKLTISNANPLRGSTKPILPVWFIDFYQYLKKSETTSTITTGSTYMNEEAVKREVDMDEVVDAKMAKDYTQRMQNFTSVEFEIDLPYHIESNGKTHFVTIAQHDLNATFEHFMVPKLDNDAFVIAHITDWENLDLLTGNANIYFGNTYVGRTVLNPSILTDTLDLSMGRDQTIAVKRTKLKSETKNKIIGSNKEYVATYQMEIRNNGRSVINLTLEDQIPKTGNEKIEIELVKDGGGTLNERTGLMTWKRKLDPGKKEVITFTYKVTYPKDQNISGL